VSIGDRARRALAWRPGPSGLSRAQLAAITRRGQQVLGLAAITGVATGAVVALFEWLARERLYDAVLRAPWGLAAICPLVGLVLAALSLRWLAGGATPSTADEYIRNYHDRDTRLETAPVPGRLLASFFTLGLGGAMGYEGPSIYAGAALGSAVQRRFTRMFTRDEAKVLLVAGAAAGVAAIFKAPATGVVFALEVPYRDDLARRMLLPASIAAAASYITFVAFIGTAPLLPVEGAPPFDLRDLLGAAVVGLLGGFGARLFSVVVQAVKVRTARVEPIRRAVVAGAILAGLAVLSHAAYGEILSLGPGYATLQWAIDPRRAIIGLVGLFFLRAAATTVTLGGGGAGGLFIPLVILGGVLGRTVAGLFGAPDSTLFPVIGVAAFLGAGYRVPLAAVMFVAETTGRPGFVVPGLVAAVVAQLIMGRWSVSAYQAGTRLGHLERRFSMPLATAMSTDVLTVPPGATVSEFFWNHLLGTREKSAPVVDGNTYLGTVRMDELRNLPREDWDTTTVAEIMRTDLPTARPDWLLRQVVEAMEGADADRLAVTDASGLFIGVVSFDDIVRLDEILDQAAGDA
jgi:CIC family chloride channel protein